MKNTKEIHFIANKVQTEYRPYSMRGSFDVRLDEEKVRKLDHSQQEYIRGLFEKITPKDFYFFEEGRIIADNDELKEYLILDQDDVCNCGEWEYDGGEVTYPYRSEPSIRVSHYYY